MRKSKCYVNIEATHSVCRQLSTRHNFDDTFDDNHRPHQLPDIPCKSTCIMDPESPPKRVTRARAAAKSDNTVRVATAASRAKATKTAPAPTKRRTRADDAKNIEEDDDEEEEATKPEPAKATRGRPRKAAAPEPEPEHEEVMETAPPAPRATRGRPKKTVVEPPPPEPTRSLRGRAKKVDTAEEPEEPKAEPEPVRKTTRGRVAAAAKPTLATTKKTVKFDEPDKENVVLPAKGKAKAAEPVSGLKAKPIRRPAPATRATRGRAKTLERTEDEKPEEKKSSPLSPKKATQVATAKPRDDSDDELAVSEKTPLKPLSRSPIKPPGSIFGASKKIDFTTSTVVNQATTAASSNLHASIMGSPARRPPPSPYKDALKASPQRFNPGETLLKSPSKAPLSAFKNITQSTGSASPFKGSTNPLKTSLLQSAAKRPASPSKFGSTPSRPFGHSGATASTPAPAFNITKFATPRTLSKSVAGPLGLTPGTTRKQVPQETGTITEESATNSPELDEPLEQVDVLNLDPIPFTGRLSSVLPRSADPAFKMPEPAVQEMQAEPTEGMAAEEAALEPQAPAAESEGAEDVLMADPSEDHMAYNYPNEEESTTPPTSPPRHSVGNFGLRPESLDPYQQSDSEDELAADSPIYSPTPLAAHNVSVNDFAVPATPTPANATKTPKSRTMLLHRAEDGTLKSSARSAAVNDRRKSIQFTPLARQLSDWMAPSPEKDEDSSEDPSSTEEPSPVKPTPAGKARRSSAFTSAPSATGINESPGRSTFFEDEMTIRDAVQESVVENSLVATELPSIPGGGPEDDHSDDGSDQRSENNGFDIEDLGPGFDEMDIDQEDMDLAAEADEMSLIQIPESEPQAEDEMMLLPTEEDDFIPGVEEEAVEDYEVALVQVPEPAPAADNDYVPAAEEEPGNASFADRSLSDASQEYGDENAVPIDPLLLSMEQASTEPFPAVSEDVNAQDQHADVVEETVTGAPAFATPVQALRERVVHTVSKVPLKAAADDTPSRPFSFGRPATVSRVPSKRPAFSESGLARHYTSGSSSERKSTRSRRTSERQQEVQALQDFAETSPTPSQTPSKHRPKSFSAEDASPSKTPQRDISAQTLKGAVVYVDAHTTEGADASGIFVDLLSQMGAKVVKSWNWNPSSPLSSPDGDAGPSNSKIGITHVVFKDGGKRTLEKVRATKGVVLCVGVGWVLE